MKWWITNLGATRVDLDQEMKMGDRLDQAEKQAMENGSGGQSLNVFIHKPPEAKL